MADWEKISPVLKDKTVYKLMGEDVISTLENMELLEKMSEEEVEDIIDYVEENLEFEWMPYVEAYIEEKLDKK